MTATDPCAICAHRAGEVQVHEVYCGAHILAFMEAGPIRAG